jgi:hypothetical protein
MVSEANANDSIQRKETVMSSWADKIVKSGEKKILPPRITLYSPPGIGKTTFASSMPKPVLIDFDHGADEVKIDAIQGPASWEETMSLIRDIGKSPGIYQTLAIDTVDPLEELCQGHVAKVAGKTFDKMNDDYGAGYQAVADEFKLFLAELDEVRKKGLHIVLISHAHVKQVLDPTLGPYDQWTAQLGKKTWSLTQRWSDIVAFAAFDAERDVKENRAIITRDRLLFTVRGSGYEAKNRYGLPAKLPLSWKALSEAIAANRATGEELTARILKLAESSAEFTEKAKAFIAQCEGDPIKLRAVEQGLLKKLAETSASAPDGKPMPKDARGSDTGAPVAAEGRKPEGAPAAPLGQVAQPAPVTPSAVESAEILRARILKLAGGTALEAQAAKFLEQVGGDVPSLTKLEAALTAKLAPNGSASPS